MSGVCFIYCFASTVNSLGHVGSASYPTDTVPVQASWRIKKKVFFFQSYCPMNVSASYTILMFENWIVRKNGEYVFLLLILRHCT